LVVGGGEVESIRAKGDKFHSILVPKEGKELTARSHIPEPYSAVVTGGGEAAPVRTEGHGTDASRVPMEIEHFAPQ
jgi:hypothetical protein